MNDKQEEEFFTQYLQGTSRLSEIYQNTDTPEPSDKINQHIIAEARKAAARKKAINSSWLAKPGSWAATIAIVSLVGLLTLNTWQKEQDELQRPLRETLAPQAPLAEEESGSPVESRFEIKEKKDSRKLIFKSAPAPVLQKAQKKSLSGRVGSGLSTEDIETVKTLADQPLPASSENYSDLSQEPGKLEDAFSSEQQQLLKIKQLLENKQLEEARQLLTQFRKKYPHYPIDPVILRHLSP